jgi:hypothetical protein
MGEGDASYVTEIHLVNEVAVAEKAPYNLHFVRVMYGICGGVNEYVAPDVQERRAG